MVILVIAAVFAHSPEFENLAIVENVDIVSAITSLKKVVPAYWVIVALHDPE